jgi:hypothetical protein
MYSPYNRNNCSLFWIPECVWNPHYKGEPDFTVWSCHTWKRDKTWLPSLQVLIKYKFRLDPAGLYRAEAKNIWTRSDSLEVYCKQKIILGDELKEYKAEIRERQERLFGYSSLYGWYIARYRFNYIAANPHGYLDTLDCDHVASYNFNMQRLGASYGLQLPEAWLGASDDRFKVIDPKTRAKHQLRHSTDGGRYPFPFNRSSYHSS